MATNTTRADFVQRMLEVRVEALKDVRSRCDTNEICSSASNSACVFCGSGLHGYKTPTEFIMSSMDSECDSNDDARNFDKTSQASEKRLDALKKDGANNSKLYSSAPTTPVAGQGGYFAERIDNMRQLLETPDLSTTERMDVWMRLSRLEAALARKDKIRQRRQAQSQLESCTGVVHMSQ